MSSHTHRTPVKQVRSFPSHSFSTPAPTPVNGFSPTTLAWRDKFKQQCLTSLRNSRQAEIRRRRFGHIASPLAGDSEEAQEQRRRFGDVVEQQLTKAFITNQWDHFRRAAATLGDLTPDLEDEILHELSSSLSSHDEELLRAYELSLTEEDVNPTYLTAGGGADTTCFVCQKGTLGSDGTAIACSGCDVRIGCAAHMRSAEEMVAQVQTLASNHAQACPGHPLFSFHEETGLLILCSSCNACDVIG
ncbi:uncharacterized protein EV422DRAFT_235393 [Fimicolochytrium jonesii]|uniref:uncharacterized protein n=1 Tax=Fimicolochytrium jonesii TaxID=1396493 RepID=UPI0022FF0EA9|nr:uncharacterized protein EV422DRAFT_235393 [Fimicolochytrium jonesii]KAI8824848.1 hypothetical protein EV422DRAFT_235393 [Fimicolochytrium jonesii]